VGAGGEMTQALYAHMNNKKIKIKKKKTHTHSVNSAGVVCDPKNSKFFISHQKESLAGHVGVKGVY
jgi:glycyl-tRNA synthetase beta subunit